MNYQQRISALQSFKSAMSGGTITDEASSFTNDISGWRGGETSKAGYDAYVKKVKDDTAKIVGKKADFISKIDKRISSIQKQFDSEYNMYKMQLDSIYDKDKTKQRKRKQNYYNRLDIDSSVKAKLAHSIR